MNVKNEIEALINKSDPTYSGMKSLSEKVFSLASERGDKLADTVRWALQNGQSIFVFNELLDAITEYDTK